MTQPIRLSSLLPGPAPGFEQPFEMLEACHEREHRKLDLLERQRRWLPQHGADRVARDAARDVMRYFDQAAPNHHRDEELHVFPPLLAAGDADTVALVRRLQQDHVQMESAWQAARAVLAGGGVRLHQGLLGGGGPAGGAGGGRGAAGELAALAPADEAALEAFAGLYDGHIEAEEVIAYPAAAALLDEPAQAAMGEEMMARRGVK